MGGPLVLFQVSFTSTQFIPWSKRRKHNLPTCGKAIGAKCRRGIILATAAWKVPAKETWEPQLSRVLKEGRHLKFISSSNGAWGAKCDVEKPGADPEAAEMQCGGRV